MSFSTEIKQMIISEPLTRTCCKKSFITGVFLAKATCYSEGNVSLYLTGQQTIEYVKNAIEDYYGKKVKVSHDHSMGIASMLSFSSKRASEFVETIEDGATVDSLFHEACDHCTSRFLRGIFLACGRMTDPSKQYLMEFSAGERIDAVEQVLWSFDMAPRRSDRRREKLLVIKDSTCLEDFLVLADINRFAFQLMNAKIEHSMKTHINRLTNCEAGNITRVVDASSRQIKAIQLLIDNGQADKLSPDLMAAAQARVAMRDASISTVAASMTPPLTKSGLAHRLEKICQIAANLKEEK